MRKNRAPFVKLLVCNHRKPTERSPLPVAGSARRDRSVTVQTEAVRSRFKFAKYVKRERSERYPSTGVTCIY